MTKNAIKTIFTSFLTVSLFGTCFCECENVRATVTQRLINEGFHRQIQYVINFNEYNGVDLWSHGACSLNVEQVIPSGAYVNPDELNDLRRHNKVNAFPIGNVDVEKPAKMSRPITIHMYSPVNSSRVKITLPIHLRYHSPRDGGGFEKFSIGYPWVYLRCPNNVFKICKPTDTVVSPCGSYSSQRCSWHNITTIPLTSALQVSVPVGDLSDLPMVALASLIVSFGGCFYVMFNFFSIPTKQPVYQYTGRKSKKE